MTSIDLPAGWTRWHEGTDGVIILTYRPDVFDAQRFPAACVPTITVKRERVRGPRGVPTSDPDAGWSVELRLEPDVVVARETADAHETAVGRARELAEAFAAGRIAYREAYQVPREEYLAELDSLLGTEDGTR